MKTVAMRRNDPEWENLYSNYIGSKNRNNENSVEGYRLITSYADVVKAVYAAHSHSDFHTTIKGTMPGPDGTLLPAEIPQIILTGSIYDGTGHVGLIYVE